MEILQTRCPPNLTFDISSHGKCMTELEMDEAGCVGTLLPEHFSHHCVKCIYCNIQAKHMIRPSKMAGCVSSNRVCLCVGCVASSPGPLCFCFERAWKAKIRHVESL